MDKVEIEKYLHMLGEELSAKQLNFDILLLGGAAMVLEVGNRDATQDIDTFFLPDTTAIFRAAAVVAARENLPDGWLNSAAAGFTYNFKKQPSVKLWKTFPGLQVYLPSIEYLFVTKIMASRRKDRGDIMALAAMLHISKREEVFRIVVQYIASDEIAQEVVEEIRLLFE